MSSLQAQLWAGGSGLHGAASPRMQPGACADLSTGRTRPQTIDHRLQGSVRLGIVGHAALTAGTVVVADTFAGRSRPAVRAASGIGGPFSLHALIR